MMSLTQEMMLSNYKYEGTDPNLATNRALQAAMELELSLADSLG